MNDNNMDRQIKVSLPNQPPPPPPVQRKKCHGNRRNQRFRRKCRAEKMKAAKIEKLAIKRNQIHPKNQNNLSRRQRTRANIASIIFKSELIPTTKQNQSQPIITTATPYLSKRSRDISSQQLSSSSSSSISLTMPKATSSI